MATISGMKAPSSLWIVGHQGLQGEVGDGDEGGDDDDVGGDAYLLGYPAFQGRDQKARGHQHEKGGPAHGQGVDRRIGDRQHGTHAQHLDEHRVVPPQPLDEFLVDILLFLSDHYLTSDRGRLRHRLRSAEPGHPALVAAVDDLHHRLGGDGGAGDGIDLVGRRFLALLHRDDLRVDGQFVEVGDEGGILVDLVTQPRGLAALQYLHAHHFSLLRQVAVEQADGVLETGAGAGYGVADQLSRLHRIRRRPGPLLPPRLSAAVMRPSR